MKKSLIYIIIAGILWGTSGIFVKLLSPFGFTSMQMTATRGIVAFICMSVFLLIKNKSLFKTTPKSLLLFSLTGSAMFFSALTYYSAMQLSSIATAVILMYMAPVYVMVYSVLFLGERFTRSKLLALIMVLIGAMLVSGIVGGMKFNLLGVILGISSGIFYAAYSILSKISIKKGNNPLTSTVYNFLMVSLISSFFINPSSYISGVSVSPTKTIPLLIALGILTYILPYFLFNLSMKTLPAGTASALGIIEPMAACIFGILFFDEKLTVFSLIGIILIFIAVFILAKSDE